MTMTRFLSPLLLALLAAPLCAAPAARVFALQEEAPQQTAAELVSSGRALLAAGNALDAEALFAQAILAEPENFDARFWQIRAWISLERINDSLNATDELASEGRKGPAMDYLYGMAFHAKAVGYLASGVNGDSIAMSFGDAVTFLSNATQADADRFQDAFYPLAESAWQSQIIDVATTAIEQATKREPKNAKAAFLQGRIMMARYATAKGDGSVEADVAAYLEKGLAAFTKTIAVLGNPKDDPTNISLMAQAWVQTAFCHAWQESHTKLLTAASNALGWNPADVDFTWIQSQAADNKELIDCLAEGGKQYAKRYGKTDPGDATLRWWLGWAHFAELQYPDAEREFTDAVTKFPTYVNCWFYIALSQYHQRKYDEAIASFTTHWGLAPANAVESLTANKNTNLPILDYLVNQCAQKGRNVEAGMLSEMAAETAQNVSRYWNNVGLFYRDTGDGLMRSKKNSERDGAADFYEKSWSGYQRAIDLEPTNPAYLNDGAVLLHYNLERNYELALEMYAQATANAESLLENENLSKDKRELFRIALRDSKNNRKLLLKKIEKLPSDG